MDLNDKDIKKIMKLVHIEREPKNRNVLDAIKKTIIPGLAGGIASAATTQIAISVAFAPLARISVNAS